MDRLLEVAGIRGFRWWRFDPQGELRSPLRTFVRWTPGMNAAVCLASRRLLPWRVEEATHSDEAPQPSCTCGFYGLHDVPAEVPSSSIARAWRGETSGSGGPEGFVLGVAEGSGRTAVGPQWWRAEFAHARALYLASGRMADGVHRASRRYGIPIYRDLDSFIGEWRPGRILADVA
ncbi:MAG TPA: hypothetical protein VGR41_09885 [Actinomycetota bacterium]|jgi:hypothetical protein|nr:hypothetical protein [Actinomycetota bacterium]